MWLDELKAVPGGRGTVNPEPPQTPFRMEGLNSYFPSGPHIEETVMGSMAAREEQEQDSRGEARSQVVPALSLWRGSLLVPRVPAPGCCEALLCAQKETLSWSSLDAGQWPDPGLCTHQGCGTASLHTGPVPSEEDRDPNDRSA